MSQDTITTWFILEPRTQTFGGTSFWGQRRPFLSNLLLESVMENYRKSKTVEKPSPLPFTNLPSDIIEMKVKDGSKIRNLMGYAFGKMESDAMRQVLFSGAGKAISKTITCVEIMKRRMKSLHQITKVFFRQTEEIWDPIVPEAGLDPLTVKRNIPAICVLLSKDPLDTKEPGYQAPGCFDAFWLETLKSESQGQAKRKQGGGRGAGRAGKHPRSVGREDAYKKP
ncbi:ribonuclease P protein subunit p25-like protein isoform X1 [Sceloporus undulatus]|uniref:ribonuclease P protein subunit p25-like protein isoform X1 n=2 Tax=Sceloporus undulatus TaxID=8520 RepID=UPI001C4D5638|nr:ribonuclease P protein subunit p25-like protein isoform X1 [Sceloporus undulatus]